jgi:hypothetical protein
LASAIRTTNLRWQCIFFFFPSFPEAMSTATTTSINSDGAAAIHRRGPPPAGQDVASDEFGPSMQKNGSESKYKHVYAIHAKTRPSTLSHDSEAAPSFVGFRNLMVIVLGKYPLCRAFSRSELTPGLSGWECSTHDREHTEGETS